MGRTESSAPTNGSADVLTGRRDTRVPPYRVRRFYGADRVVRPYKRLSGISMWDVVPQGHLFRCAPLQDAVPYNALPKTTTPGLRPPGIRKHTPQKARFAQPRRCAALTDIQYACGDAPRLCTRRALFRCKAVLPK